MMTDMVTDGMCMAHSICAYSYALGAWRMMIDMVTEALIPIDMVTDASLIATVESDICQNHHSTHASLIPTVTHLSLNPIVTHACVLQPLRWAQVSLAARVSLRGAGFDATHSCYYL